jgi:hypothetical protein
MPNKLAGLGDGGVQPRCVGVETADPLNVLDLLAAIESLANN